MKVVFKIIKAGSGSDIYFKSLSEALHHANINCEIEFYHKYFQYFPWLLKFFKKKNSGDIIHSNIEYGWVFKEKNKPLYVSILHNVFDNNYKENTSLFQKLYYQLILKPNIKQSLRKANKFIAISKYTRDSFIRSFTNKNIDVVYCWIDSSKFKPINIKSDDKRFKLLFVGNLIKRKGFDLLPKIMKNLGSNYVLYYTAGLRAHIPIDFNLPNMIPLGKLSEKELIKQYNKCDALLFPTRLEGFGYAVAEAMACGKPVITSRNSSLPELVVNNKTGYLCSVENNQEFVEKIRFLSCNRQIASIFGKEGIRRVKELFNEKKIAEEYRKILFTSKS